MEAKSRRPNEGEGAISALNAAIEALNLAKISSIPPAKAIFDSTTTLLTLVRDSMVNKLDCVELGLSCADVCGALHQVTNGKTLDEPSQSVYDAMNQLTSIVAEIQRGLVKWGKRNAVSRRFHAKNDKKAIATWRLDLDKILQVFNKEPAINTDATVSPVRHDVADTSTIVSGDQDDVVNTRVIASGSHRNALKSPEDASGQNRMSHASAPGESPSPPPRNTHGTVSDIRHDVRAIVSELERNVTSTLHRTIMKGQEGSDGKHPSIRTSISGESPPLPPRTLFGRDELIEKTVDLVENFNPIALIGAGGIGKTSIALTVLHHDRIKQRFGDHRRFIRCDQFPASHAHLLRRISDVIGAGVENPRDLTPLRTFLSSKEMLIIFDNAESILDPRGTDAEEIYAMVEELSQFNNICICITSRISTTPPDYKHLNVPALSMDPARDTFYRIYDSDDRSDLVDGILEQLDFHPLSINLLATVAHQNKWDMNRLAREWERRRTGVLQTQHNKSLAATIELSLASPMFQELGPDARALLGVVAFFPQGVDENNLEWLFPSVSARTDIFDTFCILSLMYRSNGFFTMLAPLRDYLSPKDPKTSPLLCATKEQYFTRMSVDVGPGKPNFGESRWITSEDGNVEHLLDNFTTIDANSDAVWDTCTNFITHLVWHKKRLTILQPKIEGLPDDHRSKPGCLFQLSRLFGSVGDRTEQKRLLTHTLKLWREWGSDSWVASTSIELSEANRLMGLLEEGIQQVKEALEIYERLGGMAQQADCLIKLACLLHDDKQLDAAEETALRAITLLPEEGEQYRVCRSHRILGNIYQSKGKTEKAIHHFELVLGIASPFGWHDILFWAHHDLASLCRIEGRFDDAQAHVEHAKSHTACSAYFLGYAMEEQARVWYKQYRLEEAKSEALHAADVFEKLGAAGDLERCREFHRRIQRELNSSIVSGQSGSNSQGTER